MWNGQRGEYYRGGVEAFSPTPMLFVMRHFPEGTQGQSYWYHLDGRGSVAGITQHQGQSTHNYRYDAYGQVLPAQGNWTDPHNHYAFLGKEWDEHLGLYEFGVRLYDPWAGVWLTREPLPGDAWEPRRLLLRTHLKTRRPVVVYSVSGQPAWEGKIDGVSGANG
jgi:RHS repeat-associated protein